MAWGEVHFTFLYLTLQAFCLITCTSRCYLSEFWTVSCSDWSAVLIHTFDCDWIWFAYKLLVWCEGYSSIWRNRVSSLSWNSLILASIVEAWLYCVIDWNQWITTLEGWGTCLWKALRACASCTSSCRCDLSEFWTVSRSHWSTILIHAFHCDWIWFTNELLVWSEGYCSVWRNRIGSLTWNRLLFASICESWLDCFIDWNQWVTSLEGWGTCLWNTLRTCAGCASSCRSHFSHCWCISCSNFCSVLIYTFHCDWIRSTNVLLIRRKGNRSIWIDAVFTYTWNCFR